MFHAIALQLPGSRWVLHNTTDRSVTGAGACFETGVRPMNASEKWRRMERMTLEPGVRASGEPIPWREAWQAQAREMTLRFLHHRQFPISGGQCLTIVAPAEHALDFSRSLHRAFGGSSWRSGAAKGLKDKRQNDALVQWRGATAQDATSSIGSKGRRLATSDRGRSSTGGFAAKPKAPLPPLWVAGERVCHRKYGAGTAIEPLTLTSRAIRFDSEVLETRTCNRCRLQTSDSTLRLRLIASSYPAAHRRISSE